MEFAQTTALITGAANGIGRATAIALAREGSDVVLADLDAAELASAADEVRQLGRQALAVPCDLRHDADVDRLAKEALATFGQVDLLINNAGTSILGTIDELPMESWEAVLNLNVLGTVRCVRSLLPSMLERGRGYIVNTASLQGFVPSSPIQATYNVSKYAVVGLTESLANYLRPRGLSVSCFVPTVTRTPLFDRITAVTGAPPGAMVQEPADAASVLVEGIRAEQFLILADPALEEIMSQHSGRIFDPDYGRPTP